MSLSNAPGDWRWEDRGPRGWWRIHDRLVIEDGPHRGGLVPYTRCLLPWGEQVPIPGLELDELEVRGAGDPILAVVRVSKDEANRLMALWDNPLGPCHRPFGREDYVLMHHGLACAVATSASTVSASVFDGYRRRDVVELARLSRSAAHPFALRALLRLWRVYLAPAWHYWPVGAAVSYALPGTTGDLYRFDGWRRIRKCKPYQGGGYSKPSQTNGIGDGVKTLWAYEYPK